MQPISTIALFCEDIREEKAGTVTIVGILPDNAIVPKIPGSFPRLGVYARIHLDPNIEPGKIDVLIRGPGSRVEEITTIEDKLVEKTRHDALTAGNPVAALIASLQAYNLPIAEPGRIEAIVRVDGEEYIAGILNVKLKLEK